MEEIHLVIDTKAAKAFDINTTKSSSVQDNNNYTKLDWDKVLKYKQLYFSLKYTPSYIWDHSWRL